MQVNRGRVTFGVKDPDGGVTVEYDNKDEMEELFKATLEEHLEENKNGELVKKNTSNRYINDAVNNAFFRGTKNFVLASKYEAEGVFDFDPYDDPEENIKDRERFSEQLKSNDLMTKKVCNAIGSLEDDNWKKWLACWFLFDGTAILQLNFELPEELDMDNIDKDIKQHMIEVNRQINRAYNIEREKYKENYNLIINNYIEKLLKLVPEKYRTFFEGDIRQNLYLYTQETDSSNLYRKLENLTVPTTKNDPEYGYHYFPKKNIIEVKKLRSGDKSKKGKDTGVRGALQELSKPRSSERKLPFYTNIGFSYQMYHNPKYREAYNWLLDQFYEIGEAE